MVPWWYKASDPLLLWLADVVSNWEMAFPVTKPSNFISTHYCLLIPLSYNLLVIPQSLILCTNFTGLRDNQVAGKTSFLDASVRVLLAELSI